jgi:hypothetical protein
VDPDDPGDDQLDGRRQLVAEDRAQGLRHLGGRGHAGRRVVAVLAERRQGVLPDNEGE